MNDTPEITITDTNGQSAVYVPKPETKFPEQWELSLTFVQKVASDLNRYRSGPDDFKSLIDLLIHLT